MAVHRLNAEQPVNCSPRAVDRTHRSLADLADIVLHTGGLPEHPTIQASADELGDLPSTQSG